MRLFSFIADSFDLIEQRVLVSKEDRGETSSRKLRKSIIYLYRIMDTSAFAF